MASCSCCPICRWRKLPQVLRAPPRRRKPKTEASDLFCPKQRGNSTRTSCLNQVFRNFRGGLELSFFGHAPAIPGALKAAREGLQSTATRVVCFDQRKILARSAGGIRRPQTQRFKPRDRCPVDKVNRLAPLTRRRSRLRILDPQLPIARR